MKINLLYFVFSALLVNGLVQAQTGSVQGTVVANGNAPVAGVNALITELDPLPARGAGLLPRSQRKPRLKVAILTDQNGQFVLSGLEAGRYGICIDDPSFQYLNPCAWGPATTVAVGQGAVPVNITVERAAKLTFEVDDPLQKANAKLVANGQAWQVQDLVIGVHNEKGWFVPARVVKSTGTHHSLAVATRIGVKSAVWIFSRHNLLTDDASNAVAATGLQPGLANKAFDVNGNPQTVNLRITGSH
jgi:hypothetical protein